MAATQVQTLFNVIELTEVDASGKGIGTLTINVNAILTMLRSANDIYTLITTNAAGGETYKVIESISTIIEMANSGV